LNEFRFKRYSMIKKAWLLSFICLVLGNLTAVTIYEIQYTSHPGNGSYPSDFAGQTVTTQGIVTAYGYSGNNGYYISMPEGGAWKGILVYNDTNFPTPGTMVEITGQVWEYYGLTEIRYVSSYLVISTNNPIPPAEIVTTSQAGGEAYEGVLVRMEEAVVSQEVNQYNEWAVNDGSGECAINDIFFDPVSLGGLISIGVLFDSITGIGHYGYGLYSINPRSAADLVINSEGVVVTLPTLQVPVGAQLTVPINVSSLTMSQSFQSYHFNLSYNPGLLSYQNYGITGTLSSNGTVMVIPSAGSLSVSFSSNGFLLGQGTLLNLNFSSLASGVSPLTATNFTFNDIPAMLVNQGMVTIGYSGSEVIDTLSVIQRPLLNIPAIVIPGESFSIECVAPPTTTNWAVWLYKGIIEYSLPLTGYQFETTPPRWILTAQVPNVNVFELYDLRVTASGGINDRTRHSVQVLPTRKTNYYFVHATDIHMPTHIFYPDTGYDTDSTETADFREVIKDINIIRPEFVLITGDLVNQGELEEFENMRVYSKAKRVLGEFEVPVYLVAGNHDIGGWTGTSPPAGSARKFWWKNFGWSWLDNTSSSWQYHTQDYTFEYGQTAFIGLEAYDNYDNYLPSIYGSTSFTQNQLAVLSDFCLDYPNPIVLFHHYDFAEQLNLNTLGVDMSLWGHIHYDSGSTNIAPYNLATDAVCDGGRAYRMIRVNNSSIQPYATLYAGNSGNQINVSFNPNNYGYSNSITATLVNNQPYSFENSGVKFLMPSGNSDYTVTNGVLEQVDRSGDFNVCYVRVNLTNNSTVTVTISQSGSASDEDALPSASLALNSVYPNPFRDSTTFSISKANPGNLIIKVYNPKGELVRTVLDRSVVSGNQYYTWNGRNDNGTGCPAGIYFVSIKSDERLITQKIILLK
jgi:predicted MPP superfamily phosphohydrolase